MTGQAHQRRALDQYHRDQQPDLLARLGDAKADRDARAHLICEDVAAGRTPEPREVAAWQRAAQLYDLLGDQLLNSAIDPGQADR